MQRNANSRRDVRKPPVSDALEIKRGRKYCLREVSRLYSRFANPKGRGDPAFAALVALRYSLILDAIEQQTTPEDSQVGPDDFVPVPAWALRFLVKRFDTYLRAPRGKTFGEVFELEGGGQGAQPGRDRILTRGKHQALARYVVVHRLHLLRTEGKAAAKFDNVFADIAGHTGYSIDAVRSAWKKWGKLAQKQLAPAGIILEK